MRALEMKNEWWVRKDKWRGVGFYGKNGGSMVRYDGWVVRDELREIKDEGQSSVSDPGFFSGSGSEYFFSESGSGSAKNPDPIRKNPDPWKNVPKLELK